MVRDGSLPGKVTLFEKQKKNWNSLNMWFIIIDSRFWIDLSDRRDQYHILSSKIFKLLIDFVRIYYRIQIIIPWLSLYEFSRGNRLNLEFFRLLDILRNNSINVFKYAEDERFRVEVLEG